MENLYFFESKLRKGHALRGKFSQAFTWTEAHRMLTYGLVAGGAGMGVLILNSKPVWGPDGTGLFYMGRSDASLRATETRASGEALSYESLYIARVVCCVGYFVSSLCLLAIAFSHDENKERPSRLSSFSRLLTRFVMSFVMLVPLLLPAKLCAWLGATWASGTAQLFAAGGSVLALGKLIGRYRFTQAYYAEAVASAAATNHAYSDAGCLRQLVDDSTAEQLKRAVRGAQEAARTPRAR